MKCPRCIRGAVLYGVCLQCSHEPNAPAPLPEPENKRKNGWEKTQPTEAKR